MNSLLIAVGKEVSITTVVLLSFVPAMLFCVVQAWPRRKSEGEDVPGDATSRKRNTNESSPSPESQNR